MTGSFLEQGGRGREPSVFLCQWCMASLLSMTVTLDEYRGREIDQEEVKKGREISVCLDLGESLLPYFLSVVCGVSSVSDFGHVEMGRERWREIEKEEVEGESAICLCPWCFWVWCVHCE